MKVYVQSTDVQDVYVVAPEVFQDTRGFFQEVFRADEYATHGLPTHFSSSSTTRAPSAILSAAFTSNGNRRWAS